MEVGLRADMPTYSGGLGVLAGDTLRSSADLSLPLVAVTLLHRHGYSHQKLDSTGVQTDAPVSWPVEDYLIPTPARASVTIEGRTVEVRAWSYEVVGVTGHTIPVYFLDTRTPENAEADRAITDHLYGGDSRYRLCQEIVLGIGGVRILRALGYRHVQTFHMNEGHASLLALELLAERAEATGRDVLSADDLEPVRQQCVFTTHTPVPAGHDQFPIELVKKVMGPGPVKMLTDLKLVDGVLNTTHVALSMSRYANGVAHRHAEVSRKMFPAYTIDAITNGVHAATWTSPPIRNLLDHYAPGWREDNFSIRQAMRIPTQELWKAHQEARRRLLEFVRRTTGQALSPDVFTIGFARRVATYKRADLLFEDVERLKRIHAEIGRVQLIYSGKAHPNDDGGKELIRKVFAAGGKVSDDIRFLYLENYDVEIAAYLTAGVDLWLNNPEAPLEASGTSGMKAALNGVPSLSVLDGWWIEGCIEGVTGWAIGHDEWARGISADRHRDAGWLYDKLEYVVLPMFYRQREEYVRVMRNAIAINGAYFNTQRMMQQYVQRAYAG